VSRENRKRTLIIPNQIDEIFLKLHIHVERITNIHWILYPSSRFRYPNQRNSCAGILAHFKKFKTCLRKRATIF